MNIQLKWSNLGTAKVWYEMAMRTTPELSVRYLRMSWDSLFEAALSGEI